MGDGRALAFEVEAAEGGTAWFALGVRKSGSSLFSSVVAALAQANGVNVVDVPGRMFDGGYSYPDWNGRPRLADLVWRGNAYIGFRDAPSALYDDPVFAEAPKILLVRDPRDALVSEYFSNAFSHSLPAAADGATVIERERREALDAGVERYALGRVAMLNATVEAYRPLLGDPRLLVMRYEAVIFDKERWIRDIARHFGWEADDALVRDVLGWADVRPDAEDPRAFVRRVAPGDHREKLSRAAIERIDTRLAGVWSELGYGVGG